MWDDNDSSENSLSPIPNILDLTKRPNASWKWTREEKLGASHTHQTALYIQCVIECMTKKETLQCRQSVLFNLHCSSIHPRQHAKLEQVVFICQLLKALLHRTADISTALEAVLLVSRITFATWSPFLYTSGDFCSWPEIPYALRYCYCTARALSI